MKENLFDIKLLKFLLVGVLNTIIGAGIMFMFYNLLHLNYWISSLSNYIIGGICSFFLNKFFTFKNNERSLKQIVLFIVNLLICYLVSYIFAKKIIYFIFSSNSDKLKDNIAMVTGMCLYTGLNYISQRFIIFKTTGEKSHE